MHILVPDNLSEAGLVMLAEAGLTYHAPSKMTRAEVLEVIAEADGLIVRSATKADAELLGKAGRLKAIVRAGVGVDNIDLAAAAQHNIVVMNTPQGNTIATAELTLALMLALARHIPTAQASLQSGQWDRKSFTGTELRNKTLGVVGFGRVGQAVAKRAIAFDMKVVAYDPFINPFVGQSMGVEMVSALTGIWSQADYITLHAVVTPETKHLINVDTIAKMKTGVRIINAARGALIDETALAAAIQSGKVAGAGIDVFSEEPPPAGHPLIGLPGVVHTPHLGASTNEAQEDVATEAAQKIIDALLHGRFQDVVKK